ncbi:hypothetical protein GUA87_09465 [Sneathiella sp. P13V-1]|uniref:hypothetical protein n=1 Tax=Sneathiella sp. P13V-1 TaxID=2697366 RepID=UPI00187B6941|nr:hypothetical protein [Sneathiella sp. P13V-1]MBE7637071.1 hypothetical protein [Sneathiella sp. P13V-1]
MMNTKQNEMIEFDEEFKSTFNCDPDLVANDNEEGFIEPREASFMTSGIHKSYLQDEEDDVAFESNSPRELSFHEQPYSRRGFLSE